MGLKRPKKGSVVWVPLYAPAPHCDDHDEYTEKCEKCDAIEDSEWPITTNCAFDGVELAIKHVGPKKARPWQYKVLGLQQAQADAERGKSYEMANEFCFDILGDAAGGMRGHDINDDEEDGIDVWLEVLGYLDFAALMKLMGRVMEAQSLTKRQTFCAPSASDVDAKPTAEPG